MLIPLCFLLAVNGDLNNNLVKYVQQCEGYRNPLINAIDPDVVDVTVDEFLRRNRLVTSDYTSSFTARAQNGQQTVAAGFNLALIAHALEFIRNEVDGSANSPIRRFIQQSSDSVDDFLLMSRLSSEQRTILATLNSVPDVHRSDLMHQLIDLSQVLVADPKLSPIDSTASPMSTNTASALILLRLALYSNVHAVSIQLMTWEWFMPQQRGNYRDVVFPGDRYHPYMADGFSINQFINANQRSQRKLSGLRKLSPHVAKQVEAESNRATIGSHMILCGSWKEGDNSHLDRQGGQRYDRSFLGICNYLRPRGMTSSLPLESSVAAISINFFETLMPDPTEQLQLLYDDPSSSSGEIRRLPTFSSALVSALQSFMIGDIAGANLSIQSLLYPSSRPDSPVSHRRNIASLQVSHLSSRPAGFHPTLYPPEAWERVLYTDLYFQALHNARAITFIAQTDASMLPAAAKLWTLIEPHKFWLQQHFLMTFEDCRAAGIALGKYAASTRQPAPARKMLDWWKFGLAMAHQSGVDFDPVELELPTLQSPLSSQNLALGGAFVSKHFQGKPPPIEKSPVMEIFGLVKSGVNPYSGVKVA